MYLFESGQVSTLSSNPPLLAARDEFEFACYQLHRRVSRADVIPCSLLQRDLIHRNGNQCNSLNSILPVVLSTHMKQVNYRTFWQKKLVHLINAYFIKQHMVSGLKGEAVFS